MSFPSTLPFEIIYLQLKCLPSKKHLLIPLILPKQNNSKETSSPNDLDEETNSGDAVQT